MASVTMSDRKSDAAVLPQPQIGNRIVYRFSGELSSDLKTEDVFDITDVQGFDLDDTSVSLILGKLMLLSYRKDVIKFFKEDERFHVQLEPAELQALAELSLADKSLFTFFSKDEVEISPSMTPADFFERFSQVSTVASETEDEKPLCISIRKAWELDSIEKQTVETGLEEVPTIIIPPPEKKADLPYYAAQSALADVIMEKIVEKIGNDKFDEFRELRFVIGVPRFKQLKVQTTKRLKDASLDLVHSVAEKYKTDFVDKDRHDNNKIVCMYEKSVVTEMLKHLQEESMDEKKLILVIVDECHWGITKEGAHNILVNDQTLCERKNVIIILVSATPYNVLSSNTRILEKNIIDWSEGWQRMIREQDISKQNPFVLRVFDEYESEARFLSTDLTQKVVCGAEIPLKIEYNTGENFHLVQCVEGGQSYLTYVGADLTFAVNQSNANALAFKFTSNRGFGFAGFEVVGGDYAGSRLRYDRTQNRFVLSKVDSLLDHFYLDAPRAEVRYVSVNYYLNSIRSEKFSSRLLVGDDFFQELTSESVKTRKKSTANETPAPANTRHPAPPTPDRVLLSDYMYHILLMSDQTLDTLLKEFSLDDLSPHLKLHAEMLWRKMMEKFRDIASSFAFILSRFHEPSLNGSNNALSVLQYFSGNQQELVHFLTVKGSEFVSVEKGVLKNANDSSFKRDLSDYILPKTDVLNFVDKRPPSDSDFISQCDYQLQQFLAHCQRISRHGAFIDGLVNITEEELTLRNLCDAFSSSVKNFVSGFPVKVDKHSYLETEQIIQALFESAKPQHDNSSEDFDDIFGNGKMALLRIANLDRGVDQKFYQQVKRCFDVLASVTKRQVVTLFDSNNLDLTTSFQKVCLGSSRQVKEYSDLNGIPCLLILNQKGRMGDTFPESLHYMDLRLQTGANINLSTTMQELGRLCRYSKRKQDDLPRAILCKSLMKRFTDGLFKAKSLSVEEILRATPDEYLLQKGRALVNATTSLVLNDIRKLFKPSPGSNRVPANYDHNNNIIHERRFILTASPQIGKTGTYLAMLYKLQQRIGFEDVEDCVAIDSPIDVNTRSPTDWQHPKENNPELPLPNFDEVRFGMYVEELKQSIIMNDIGQRRAFQKCAIERMKVKPFKDWNQSNYTTPLKQTSQTIRNVGFSISKDHDALDWSHHSDCMKCKSTFMGESKEFTLSAECKWVGLVIPKDMNSRLSIPTRKIPRTDSQDAIEVLKLMYSDHQKSTEQPILRNWIFVPSIRPLTARLNLQHSLKWMNTAADVVLQQVVVSRNESEYEIFRSLWGGEIIIILLPQTVIATKSKIFELDEKPAVSRDTHGVGYARLFIQNLANVLDMRSVFMMDDNIIRYYRLAMNHELMRHQSSVSFARVLMQLEQHNTDQPWRYSAEDDDRWVPEIAKSTSRADGNDIVSEHSGAWSSFGMIGVGRYNGAYSQDNLKNPFLSTYVCCTLFINLASAKHRDVWFEPVPVAEDLYFAYDLSNKGLKVIKFMQFQQMKTHRCLRSKAGCECTMVADDALKFLESFKKRPPPLDESRGIWSNHVTSCKFVEATILDGAAQQLKPKKADVNRAISDLAEGKILAYGPILCDADLAMLISGTFRELFKAELSKYRIQLWKLPNCEDILMLKISPKAENKRGRDDSESVEPESKFPRIGSLNASNPPTPEFKPSSDDKKKFNLAINQLFKLDFASKPAEPKQYEIEYTVDAIERLIRAVHETPNSRLDKALSFLKTEESILSNLKLWLQIRCESKSTAFKTKWNPDKSKFIVAQGPASTPAALLAQPSATSLSMNIT